MAPDFPPKPRKRIGCLAKKNGDSSQNPVGCRYYYLLDSNSIEYEGNQESVFATTNFCNHNGISKFVFFEADF